MEQRSGSRALTTVALAIAVLLLGFGSGWLGGSVAGSSTSAPGPTGPPGADGAAGADGGDGAQGPAGPTGIAGPQGVTGPQGLAGPRGATGPHGATGPQGATGSQGLAGTQGTAGADGLDGAPGLDATSLTGLYVYSNDDDAAVSVGLVFPFTTLRDIDGVEPTSLGGPPGSPYYAFHVVEAGYYRVGMSAAIRTTAASNAAMHLQLTYVGNPFQALIEGSGYDDSSITRMAASGLVHLQIDDYVRFALVPESPIVLDSYDVIFTVEKLG